MSKIKQIEIYYVSIPLPTIFYPAWIPGFPQNENRFALIRVLTEDGIEGWSTGPVIGKEHATLANLIGPYLIGEDATDIETIQQRIREVSYIGWRNFWIEPAFWDIKGKVEGKSLCELLGGKPRTVKLYASTGELKNSTQRIKEVEQRYNEGFTSIKLKIHHMDEKMDNEQVQGTAKAMDGKIDLHVDANQGWRVAMISNAPLWDLERAKRFSDVCAAAGVKSLEEPLAMDDYDSLCELTKYSKIPVAGGELHSYGYPELKMMIERKCYSIFTPDAVFCGGVAQVWNVIQLLKKHNLRFSGHTWLNGISFAINLQIMAASGYADTEEIEYPYAPPGWTVEARDQILEEPFYHKKSTIETPTAPGLGFKINKKTLRKYGTRIGIMNQPRLTVHSLRSFGLKVSLLMDKALKERKTNTFNSNQA
ncbi:MAG TPA: mandelate racemase/muconate lactonizing enzyme family protein [Methylomusa anaerophila]|uniref:Putative isomerase YitF n=1 Tax=Methylomusa anaerophila TaxID=1930071 RepID=A0A348AQS1_9FIRM|nr:mandelate racemase/muconate lactonizing enzyme family protein [Methylomusa anaerophila]BBB93419.1 putative isomerase YitF [Methylomusa anaerophila]HML90044.1 mandelate racemase/muconate lactonizing enzyme family protein [Methylomusa anaerophila]